MLPYTSWYLLNFAAAMNVLEPPGYQTGMISVAFGRVNSHRQIESLPATHLLVSLLFIIQLRMVLYAIPGFNRVPGALGLLGSGFHKVPLSLLFHSYQKKRDTPLDTLSSQKRAVKPACLSGFVKPVFAVLPQLPSVSHSGFPL